MSWTTPPPPSSGWVGNALPPMLAGLRAPPYWLACYLFDNCAMFVPTCLTVAIFAFFGRDELVGSPDRYATLRPCFPLDCHTDARKLTAQYHCRWTTLK